jgi:hypothetical protein
MRTSLRGGIGGGNQVGEEMTLSVLPRSATMLCDGMGQRREKGGEKEEGWWGL